MRLAFHIIALSFVLAAGTGFAQGDNGRIEIVVDGTSHQALYSVAFDNASGIAVGAMGAVLETEDGGKTWKSGEKKLTVETLLGADIKGSRKLIVGQAGLIFLKDGSSGWQKVASGTDKRLLSISTNSKGLAFAVGGFGTALKSTDGGRTWKPRTFDWGAYLDDAVEPHLYDVNVNEDGVVTVIGEFELVLRSADGGETWKLVHKGEASLFDLQMRADGTGFAVGQSGTVLRTTDRGLTWSRVNAGSSAILLGVWSSPDGKVVVTGMRDMLASDDDGKTWRHVADGDVATAWYQGVGSSTGGGGVLAVGHSGRIVRVSK